MSGWLKKRGGGMNEMQTSMFLNTFNPRNFSSPEVVARESIQNSMDAGLHSEGLTEIEFHHVSLSSDKKQEFLKLFEFDEAIRPILSAIEDSEVDKSLFQYFESFLDTDDQLDALIIRDFKTSGLSGKIGRTDRTDYFFRLVCSLGLDDKSNLDASYGGSFGIGKTVYSINSGINTVIYHSTFAPSQDTDNVKRRLMVQGIYPKHKIDDEVYTGFYYYGDLSDEEASTSDLIPPLSDNNAEEKWSKLIRLFGSERLKREDNEHGTDIVILCPRNDTDSADPNSLTNQLKKAIEDYYFPALLSEEVSIKLFDKDGNKHHPDPQNRDDLDQFISLYQNAQAYQEPDISEKDLWVKKLRQFPDGQGNMLKLGKYAYQVAEVDEAESDKNNHVAIVRKSNTKMIINYLKCGSERFENAVGVFVAHEDANDALILSEDNAHSEWNHNNDKLKRRGDDFYGRKLVQTVNERIQNNFNNFKRSLKPVVETDVTSNSALSKLLSDFLGGAGGNPPLPPGEENPCSVSLIEQSIKTDGLKKWKLELKSNEYTNESSLYRLSIVPKISVVGKNSVPIKRKKIIIKGMDGVILDQGEKPSYEIDFKKGDRFQFFFEYKSTKRHDYKLNVRFTRTEINQEIDNEQ